MKDILVIENERMIFLDIKITFANAGFNVILANSYNIASLAASGVSADLVIADVKTATGVFKELYKVLKSNSAYKGTPVILTNSGSRVLERFCLRKKINVIAEVDKPYNSADLLFIYHQYLIHSTEVKHFDAADFVYRELVMS
ncbi:MAG TPA: hypothetical protein VK177_13855 [Flavobacteriales bacterium]|nr:hypothetical protein [Flavobacteriales bacterium]